MFPLAQRDFLPCGAVFAGFQDTMGTWLQTPWGRFMLLLALLALLSVALLLILIPLARRSSTLLLHSLAVRLEGARLGVPTAIHPREDSSEAKGLVESVNRLVEGAAGRERELRGRVGQLEALLDLPRDVGLLATDAEGRITTFGPGASALLGYSAAEVTGRHIEALFPDAAWKDLLPKLTRRSLREEGLRLGTVMIRRDRAEMPVTISIGPEPAAREPYRFVALLQDAGAQRQEARRLQQLQRQTSILLETVQDAVLVCRDGRIAEANSASEGLFGARREELIGLSFKELLAPEDLLSGLHHLDVAQDREESVEFTARLAAGSGAPRRVRIRLKRFPSGPGFSILAAVRGEATGSRGPMEDASIRQLLDAALDSASEGILVQEAEPAGATGFLLVNRRLEEFLGAAGRAVLAWSPARLVEELRARGASAEGLALPHAPEDPPLVVTLHAPVTRTLEVRSGPLRDAAGGLQGRVLTFRDISASRAAERALREGHDDLAAARARLEEAVAALQAAKADLAARNEQLERLNRDLRSVDEMKSGLLANVSHELQTPLVLIKGYTEMILKRKIGPLTGEQEKGLGVALRNIDRLVDMIDNLLDFSRMERGESPLDLEEFPLWQVIDEAVELLRGRLEAAGISLTTEYETDDVMVRADRGKISQVFINLLSNAVKFNRPRGSIEIRVGAPEDGKLAVEISDTGIGIPPAEQERIFDRFYQVESTPQRQEGTGIGLSIVKEIVALHQCEIAVESVEGEGSRFRFTLPRGVSPAPPRPRPGRRQGHPQAR